MDNDVRDGELLLSQVGVAAGLGCILLLDPSRYLLGA